MRAPQPVSPSPPRSGRPLALRLLNAAGRLAGRAGLRRPRLDEGSLLEAAARETGLTDFGPPSFRAGLRALCEALEREAQLSQVGRMGARRQLVGHLANRLRVLDHRKRHPEVAAQEIRQPLFVIGLPRTGTTLLYGLLAQDPAHRSPQSWEVAFPCPPPEVHSYATDPRIARAEQQFDGLRRLIPGYETIHPVGARLPQECILIHALDFHSVLFETSYDVPSYQAWLERQDLRPTYRFQRAFLQHLQSRYARERWVLKSPAHLLALDALLDVFPDARLVQTHRDPLEVLASVASLHAAQRGGSSDRVDPHHVGRQQLELWSRLLPRALAVRDRRADRASRFFDVDYRELVADPLASVRGIYRHFDLELGAGAEASMRRFLAEYPKDRHGTHRYALETFGLDADEVTRRFAVYWSRFGAEPDALRGGSGAGH